MIVAAANAASAATIPPCPLPFSACAVEGTTRCAAGAVGTVCGLFTGAMVWPCEASGCFFFAACAMGTDDLRAAGWGFAFGSGAGIAAGLLFALAGVTDDLRFGAATGNGLRDSAVSACPVTHTGDSALVRE